MKNLRTILTKLVCGVAFALLLTTAVPADAACVVTSDGSGVMTKTLWAGQNIDAGTVSVEVSGSDLIVTYATYGGWELVEVHLWAGTNVADMPANNKGNPKIGNFPYIQEEIFADLWVFTIPLADIGFVQNPDGTCEDQTLYAAAHAALRKSDGSGGYQTETGWADGDRIVTRGNWATMFSFDISCSCDGGPGNPTGCETAFAYGGSSATCFLDLGLDINRWGWSNGALAEGYYEFDIYAGAGQCDLSKGTLVGTLSVNYTIVDGAGSAEVTYLMDSLYTMDETHLFIGSEILARDVNGDFTVAPGQYPYIHDLTDATSDSFTIGGLSGNIYVVAHAVVCGFEE